MKKNVDFLTSALTVGILSMILLTSCSGPSSNAKHYLGEWIGVENKSETFKILESGDNYILDSNGDKYPATMKDGMLEVSTEMGANRIMYDENTDKLIFSGNEFMRMTGDLYIGNWKLIGGPGYRYGKKPEDFLVIEKINKKYQLTFLPDFNFWGASGDFIYEMEYKDFKLIGYPGGHGQIVIEVEIEGNDRINFSYIPFAHDDIKDNIYEKTNSVFRVISGDDFVGTWHINNALFLTIKKTDDQYMIDVGNFGQWKSFYKNKQLYATTNPPGNIASRKPVIKFVEADKIEVSNFYFEGGADHVFYKK